MDLAEVLFLNKTTIPIGFLSVFWGLLFNRYCKLFNSTISPFSSLTRKYRASFINSFFLQFWIPIEHKQQRSLLCARLPWDRSSTNWLFLFLRNLEKVTLDKSTSWLSLHGLSGASYFSVVATQKENI